MTRVSNSLLYVTFCLICCHHYFNSKTLISISGFESLAPHPFPNVTFWLQGIRASSVSFGGDVRKRSVSAPLRAETGSSRVCHTNPETNTWKIAWNGCHRWSSLLERPFLSSEWITCQDGLSGDKFIARWSITPSVCPCAHRIAFPFPST